MMRLFGWSVKKTLPLASHVGPSVKAKSPASFSSFAPGAITLYAATSGTFASRKQIKPTSNTHGFPNFMQTNLRWLKILSDLKPR